MSIRVKIILGCLCLSMLTIVVGLLAQTSQREIGELATRLYDNSLVSTNALRSAQASVIKLKTEIGLETDEAEQKKPLPKGYSERVQVELTAAEADLALASAGSISKTGRDLVDQARRRLTALVWSGSNLTPRFLAKELGVVDDELGATVRIFAADAYGVKGSVGEVIKMSIARTWATIGAAVALTLLVAWLLSRMIVPTLRRAVAVTKAIADGNLSNEIASSGSGEAAELLTALADMQSTIAERIDRFETTVAKQADAFDGERELQSGRLQAALENMNQGLCMFDAKGKVVLVNRRFLEIFDYPEIEVGVTLSRLAKLPRLTPVLGGPHRSAAFSHQTDDGRMLVVNARKIAAGGQVVTVEDVTGEHDAALKLDHVANHDGMTGLPNRIAMQARLEAIFEDRQVAERTAILCLDIDGFKFVNESFGHPVGDALLKQVAGRLLGLAAADDFVARIGGDDFAIVRTGLERMGEMEALAEAIITALKMPFQVLGQSVAVGVSVGIAPAREVPVEVEGVEALLKKADLALAMARTAGRNRYRFFEPSMETEASTRRRTEIDLSAAIDNGELELFYQPFIDVPMQTVSGFEALLRWRHPIRGMVPPGEFVPIAEDCGLIAPIGLWVLETACRHAVDWPTGLTVAVNLSPTQFRSETLLHDVKAILKRTGFEPYRLQLEVTEGVFLHDSEHVLQTLTAFRKLGIRISMDDFGTGYSSLGYLSRFPFDKVKIDQSFVRDLAKRENLMIVRAIIGLSKAMGLSVMAEGVETRRQMETLLAESCAEMQGYHFAMPMPLAELPRFMMQFSLDRSEPRSDAARRA